MACLVCPPRKSELVQGTEQRGREDQPFLVRRALFKELMEGDVCGGGAGWGDGQTSNTDAINFYTRFGFTIKVLVFVYGGLMYAHSGC